MRDKETLQTDVCKMENQPEQSVFVESLARAHGKGQGVASSLTGRPSRTRSRTLFQMRWSVEWLHKGGQGVEGRGLTIVALPAEISLV
jgi:hypothetical protein